MRQRAGSRRGSVLACVFGYAFVVGGCGAGSSSENQTLSALEAKYGCSEDLPSITHASSDSLDERQRCILVTAALSALASARNETGLRAGDSAQVEHTYITPLAIQDSTGRLLHRYWSVSLALRDRPYDAEVQIDRGDGSVTARRIHKPIR